MALTSTAELSLAATSAEVSCNRENTSPSNANTGLRGQKWKPAAQWRHETTVEAMFGQKEKERRMLIGLAARLIHSNPEMLKTWKEVIESHEYMKDSGAYRQGFIDAGGDAKEMELQISLMKEILRAEEVNRINGPR